MTPVKDEESPVVTQTEASPAREVGRSENPHRWGSMRTPPGVWPPMPAAFSRRGK